VPRIKLFGGLRRHVTEYEFEVPGRSIKEVLKTLCENNAALGEAIFEGGELRTHIRVLIAGRAVELDEGLDTIVGETDEIAIFPPIAGGSVNVPN
jgi:molybdopterin synthase sulfur carrier subunit